MLAADDVEDVDQAGQGARGVLTIARSRTDRIYYLRFCISLCFDCFRDFKEGF